MLYQDWRDCVFLHWAQEPAALRRLVPAAFELETFEGRAWVSLIAFRIARMRPGLVPAVPGLTSANEAHLRTYVRGPDGRGGIWMLSIDIDPLQAALMGRGFALAYRWASMDVSRDGDRVAYDVRRRSRIEARLQLGLTVGEDIAPAKLGPRDHFLTARWVLYAGVGPVRAAIFTEHPRWRFRRATVASLDESMLAAVGLPAKEPPLIHFSDGVDARLSWPRPFLSLRG
jgi:uncharacterized protein YqjF (DUF2071 family)